MRTRHFITGFVFCAATGFVASAALAETTSTTIEKRRVNEDVRREKLSIEIGHNATPTTWMMPKNTWTVGPYGVAYQAAEDLMIATSPWLWYSYNTANLNLKWVKRISSGLRVGVFSSYFESYESRPFIHCEDKWRCDGTLIVSNGKVYGTGYGRYVDRYQFQALTNQALLSFDASRFTITSALKYSYFFNDDKPYSLRPDPGTDKIRGQIDLTFLVEKPLANHVQLNVEFGSLGLNDLEPYLHLGSSVSVIFSRWLVQLGGSLTTRFSSIGTDEFWDPGAFEQRVHTSKEGQLYNGRYLVMGLHPEIQVQYFF